jgi:hypothetical protein
MAPSVACTFAAATVVACAGPCFGTVVFTSATRTVTAVATNSIPQSVPPADIVTNSFNGLSSYDQIVQRQIPTIDQPPGAMQQGFAEQHSLISGTSVAFSGNVFGQDLAVSSGSGYGSGRSQLVLHFTVSNDPAPWTFAQTTTLILGQFTSVDFAGVTIQNSASATVVSFQPLISTIPSGTLVPDSYTMTFDLLAGYGGPGTGSSGLGYNWSFNIPAPATGALAGAMGLLAVRRRRG